MARAAGNACREATRFGLLAALASGCATIQEPPGGPPDFTPPIILSVSPDSGAVVDGFRADAVFQFDEVISERSGGGLENLVRLSPRHEEISVSWKRSRITVKPKGGWNASAIYHLTLLPGVTDLQNNRLDSTRTVIFSTGGPIPDTRLSGTVIDWEGGRAAGGALIEAVLIPDSLVYTGTADSVGDYTLTAIPSGTYLVYGTIDQNNNRQRDGREAFDSARVVVDSTAAQVLWTFAHDSVGPRITAASIDSVTIRVSFTQKLSPNPRDTADISVFALPDTVQLSVASVWLPAAYDSVRSEEAAAAAAAEAAAAAAQGDSAAAETPVLPDSVADARPLPVPPARERERPTPADSAAVPADTSAADRLLAERPRLNDELIVRLLAPLTPGTRVLVVANATNVSGAASEAQAVLAVPAASDSS